MDWELGRKEICRDRVFVERLQRATENPRLDVLWNPKGKILRAKRDVRGGVLGWTSSGLRGVWEVVMWCDIPFDVWDGLQGILGTYKFPVPVLKLNGKFFHPRDYGEWVIDALNEADAMLRGFDARNGELNEWVQNNELARRLAGERAMAEGIDHGLLRRVLSDMADEDGVEMRSKQERIASAAAMHAREEAARREMDKEMKTMEFAA